MLILFITFLLRETAKMVQLIRQINNGTKLKDLVPYIKKNPNFKETNIKSYNFFILIYNLSKDIKIFLIVVI